jgi:hypothetical protein
VSFLHVNLAFTCISDQVGKVSGTTTVKYRGIDKNFQHEAANLPNYALFEGNLDCVYCPSSRWASLLVPYAHTTSEICT